MERTNPVAHSELIEPSVVVVESVDEGEEVPGGIAEVAVGSSTSLAQDSVKPKQGSTKGSAVHVEALVVKDVP